MTEIVAGEIELNDHDKIAWVNPNQLSSFDFAPADLPIIDSILKNTPGLKRPSPNAHSRQNCLGENGLKHAFVARIFIKFI